MQKISHVIYMTTDVKTTKSNKWVSFTKKFAAESGMSYRQAMRSEACKSAYKAPPERSPSPVRTPSPEPVPSPEPLVSVKGKKKVKAVPEVVPVLDLPVPYLVRSEPYSEPLIPTVIKKVRVKRVASMVPT